MVVLGPKKKKKAFPGNPSKVGNLSYDHVKNITLAWFPIKALVLKWDYDNLCLYVGFESCWNMGI